MNIDLIKLVNDANSLRPNTKTTYLTVVKQWLAFAGPDSGAWTVAMLQDFYNGLLARGLGIPSANGMINGGIAFVFRRAHALYGIPNIVGGIDLSTAVIDPATGRRALTSLQAQNLLKACAGTTLPDLRDHALVLLGLHTGLRRMSLAALDLASVTVMPGTSAVVIVRAFVKGGSWYYVPLDSRVWAQLKPYRVALAEVRPGHGPLFPGIPQARLSSTAISRRVPGDHLTESGIYSILRQRAESVGLKGFHPHLLRHTFVTWCRVGGMDSEHVAIMTGHKSRGVSMMIDTYTDNQALYVTVATQAYEAVARQLG